MPLETSNIGSNIHDYIDDWYRDPELLPEIGLSDHQSIVKLPIIGETRKRGERVAITVRSNDSNSKSQLDRHLAAFNWSPL